MEGEEATFLIRMQILILREAANTPQRKGRGSWVEWFAQEGGAARWAEVWEGCFYKQPIVA